MSGICSALCCWKSKESARYSPDSGEKESVGYQAPSATLSRNIPAVEDSGTSYQRFTPPPSNRVAKSVTPDSAYGDVDTYQGEVTDSKTPPKGQYGAIDYA